MIDLVNDSDLSPHDAHPLIITLNAAGDSFDRSNPSAGLNQLTAFHNKTRSQISPTDPVLAKSFIEAAQKSIAAFGGSGKPSSIVRLKHGHCGKPILQFTGERGGFNSSKLQPIWSIGCLLQF